MKQYTQLSQEERYDIQAALKSKTSVTELSRTLNRSRSTIYRERSRNQGKRGYRAKQAHELSKARHYKRISAVTEFGKGYIECLLRQGWSPEQISGALKHRGWDDVPSHEWIYQYVYSNKAAGGDLHAYLRHQKTYRKRGLKGNDRRGQLVNRTSIHARSQEIEERQRLGDFEADTIIGKHHKGAILTLVERKSLYTHIVHLGATRASKKTIGCCIERLQLSHAYSVTFDNGKEFAEHQQLQTRGIDTYFADPYRSNQRARNENTNGLIRQYLPKSSAFDTVLDTQIQAIEEALNNRPRKSLGWFTPSQVMANFYTVALAA